jgi:hypothetical protein
MALRTQIRPFSASLRTVKSHPVCLRALLPQVRQVKNNTFMLLDYFPSGGRRPPSIDLAQNLLRRSALFSQTERTQESTFKRKNFEFNPGLSLPDVYPQR